MNVVEFAVATGDQALYRSENIQLGEDPKGQTVAPRPGVGAGGAHLGGGGGTFGGGRGSCSPCSPPAPDYKNNILKERAELVHSPPPPKNLDKGESR